MVRQGREDRAFACTDTARAPLEGDRDIPLDHGDRLKAYVAMAFPKKGLRDHAFLIFYFEAARIPYFLHFPSLLFSSFYHSFARNTIYFAKKAI
jgi:hypothetical protein